MAAGVGGFPALVVGAPTVGCAGGAPVYSVVWPRVSAAAFWVAPASTCNALGMACVWGVVVFTGIA